MVQETVREPWRDAESGQTEHQLACWLGDQRMAFALGQLPASKVAKLEEVAPGVMEEPPSGWEAGFMKSLAREFRLRSQLPEEPTWAEMAVEARKIISHEDHIHTPNKWLNNDSNGYFALYALDHPED